MDEIISGLNDWLWDYFSVLEFSESSWTQHGISGWEGHSRCKAKVGHSDSERTCSHPDGTVEAARAARETERVSGSFHTMPSLRHSYTLSVLEEPNRHRKTSVSRSKLVSTVMGLIINQAKVSPAEPVSTGHIQFRNIDILDVFNLQISKTNKQTTTKPPQMLAWFQHQLLHDVIALVN